MNYLAHIYLAKHSADAQFGALLGDFLRPGQDQHLPLETRIEIQLHRRIDSFTDQHPLNFQARALFGQGRRRYAGIVLDVFYDHVLAKHWEHICALDFDDFVEQFYVDLMKQAPHFPESLSYAAPRMREQDWIRSYRDLQGFELTIQRMSRRLSRNADLLRAGIDDVRRHYHMLTQYFFEFFPELERFALTERERIRAGFSES